MHKGLANAIKIWGIDDITKFLQTIWIYHSYLFTVKTIGSR